LIDEAAGGERRFGVGDFDLVVIGRKAPIVLVLVPVRLKLVGPEAAAFGVALTSPTLALGNAWLRGSVAVPYVLLLQIPRSVAFMGAAFALPTAPARPRNADAKIKR